MTDYIHEVEGESPDFRTELARKLEELMPEAIADGKVDVTKLKELLADDTRDESERFGLFWPGKRRALKAAQSPTTATLKPAKAESKDWGTTNNVFIEGDNLEVLKVLQRHYHGKVKMIYIDPPYNTGGDFIYPDNFREGLRSYLEFTRQIDEEGKKLHTNTESDGRFHSHWLSMMYPRLKLARNLLSHDGLIFVSIDDHEAENLKKLLSEVFGEQNYVATLVWDTNHSAQAGIFKTYHQYILVYARQIGQIGPPRVGNGEEFEAGAQKRPSSRHPVSEFEFPAGTEWRAPDGTELEGTWGGVEDTKLVTGRMVCEGGRLTEAVILAAAWTQKSQMQQYFHGDAENLVDSRGQRISGFYFSKSGKLKLVKERGVLTPSTVRREYGSQGAISTSLAALFEMDETPFDSPKPVSMVQEFASWFTNGEDIVLDFFSGSGTTAHAVMAANAADGGNRRHIQVQLPEPTGRESRAFKAGFATIPELARERIKRAGEAIKSAGAGTLEGSASSLDIGYRTYTLVDTNFAKWRVTSDVEPDELQERLEGFRDQSNDVASAEDLLAEILLKQGYSLSEEVCETEVSGLLVHSIGGGLLLAYLDESEKPSLDQLRAMVALGPARIVVLEDAFQGDDELKANIAESCKSNQVELWTA